MEKVTDWLTLWQQLANAQSDFWKFNKAKKKPKTAGEADSWTEKAKGFDAQVRKRWNQPDSTRDHLLGILTQHPEASVLDIGAGTGAWALLMARHVRQVTALDPSSAMLGVLSDNARESQLDNITIIEGGWPETRVEPHDFSLASHSLYGVADFKTAIERMNSVTRHTCFLVLRICLTDSLMDRAARLVWGQPYDSPNFQVAYNALLQMGIYPNVLLETPNHWEPWRHDSFEEALAEMVGRFGLAQGDGRIAGLEQLLKDNLIAQEDGIVWPPGTRSAIVSWRPGQAA